MSTFLASYTAALDLMRVALFYLAAALAVVFGLDWLVRTRRLNPFGPVARFFRSSVDPMLAPMERTVVRAGGTPASAPWWALVAVVIGGILLISLMGMLGEQIGNVAAAAGRGPGGVLVFLATATLAIIRIALFVRVISSWVRVSPYSPWVRWTYGLTEWLLAPLRRLVPTIGMIDITPIVAYCLLLIVGNALIGMLARAVL